MIVTLMQGDCLELMPTLPDQSIDMVMADVPYGITNCRWDTIIPFEPMWKEIERLIKPHGAIVMTACQPFTSMLTMSNLRMFRYDLVWDKKNCSGFLNSKKMPLRAHENVLVFYKHLPTYNPQKTFGNKKTGIKKHPASNSENYRKFLLKVPYANDGSRFPTSVIGGINGVVNNSREKIGHSTQKPIALMEYLIKTYTNEGDVVLDFAAGLFTTGVACINLNRNFIGIEKEKDFFELGARRIKEAELLKKSD